MAGNSCVFCGIASGAIPARLVYDDDHAVAFEDLSPQAPVHLLVVPRQHIASLDHSTEADRELLGCLLSAVVSAARARGLERSGYRTVINTGAGAGQTVFHLHLHVLGGRPLEWPPG